jgi:hypothetical protein
MVSTAGCSGPIANTGMAVQKFPNARGLVMRELLNQSHTSECSASRVPCEPEVRKRDCRNVCANFGFGTRVQSHTRHTSFAR